MAKKRKSVVGQGTPRPDTFQGEVMTCRVCGKQEKSDPERESGWTALQLNNEIKAYFCPSCWHTAGEKAGHKEVMRLAVLCLEDGRALRLFRSLVGG